MNGAQFDRDITLGELLRAIPAAKLDAALSGWLSDGWQIVDADGAVVRGAGLREQTAPLASEPLYLDFEVIGRLAANAPRERVAASATWLELALLGAQRYHMAADLHVEAVNADYTALQREHTALQESEARYRELASQLEQRVEAQVKVIERAQRQLYQTEKMASVGSLAAGMAHEINNPLGFIRSNLGTANGYIKKIQPVLNAYHQHETEQADVAWRKLDLGFVLEDFSGLLAESVNGADRIARIIANLKAYASIDCVSAAETDLNDAVRTVSGLIGDQLPDGIAIETDLQTLPAVPCDPGRINQMLFALMQNARQAIQTHGRIRVTTALAGDEIRIVVSDDGCGIPAENVNRIFDPFFTTREVGKGTGLGLTVCRDIVTAHGGRLDVDSTPDVGSTFTVYLPLTAGASA